MSDPSDPRSSSPEPRLAIGEMAVKAYGKYFLIKKLAEGGMAEIFLAKQLGVEGFEKNVVIKRMLPHLSAASDFVSMFLDEARLAASLTHSNIVQISDLGFADGCYFICMEYLAGEDLATVLRTEKRRGQQAPVGILLRVFTEAAIGLHFAHEALDPKGVPMRLVHRDISPSNIFVTYGGQVKVLDFGIAKAESRVTTTGAGVVKGKYQYMSPEQAHGDAIDRRSDIFSLGVSLYEALTGVRPFARDTDLAVLKAVLSGDYQPLRALRPDLPLEVEQIVTKAMAQEPEHRYPSALAFAQEIERYVGATTSSTGGQALTQFMTGLFGPDRVKSKMRIESLDELAKRGVDIPGRPNPLAIKTAVDDVKLDISERTNAIGAPLTVQTQQRAQSRRLKVLMAAALVVGIAGTVIAMKVMTPAPQPLLTPPVVLTAPLIDAGLPEVVVIDAGLAEVTIDAGAPEPVVVVKSQKPVTLTTAMVQKGISLNKGRFQKCFKENKPELPAPQGTLKVTFAIASTGRVSSVSTDLEGTSVSKCIQSVVKGMTFPRHVDLEVRVPIALNWDVR
ncbi:MAG: protein kinase [Archangium sp.]|nr:protein kinase [Archangium sp.]MDP3154929.1 protein kinase [Archangium sp.]MDP3576048.1 protein kinase [Archangium sp.]